jgi:hypothetical protein
MGTEMEHTLDKDDITHTETTAIAVESTGLIFPARIVGQVKDLLGSILAISVLLGEIDDTDSLILSFIEGMSSRVQQIHRSSLEVQVTHHLVLEEKNRCVRHNNLQLIEQPTV